MTLTVYFGSGSVKVEDSFALLGVDGNLEFDWAPVVHIIDGTEVLPFESPANVFQ